MRPVNSMIEFKQIIGRGTRLYDGKDYFTIYDFVKAYEHFNDPEWDGEPLDPVPTSPKRGKKPAPIDGDGANIDGPDGDGEKPATRQKIRIRLADGKERTIQHMMSTSFWSADGRPISESCPSYSRTKMNCGPSGVSPIPAGHSLKAWPKKVTAAINSPKSAA